MKKYTLYILFVFLNIIMPAQPTHEFQKILASDGQPDDMFGASLAIQENIAVFGTPQDDDVVNNAGAVYVYERNGTSWGFKQKLTISESEEADMLGEAVGIDGNFIVASAYQAAGITGNTGAAYIWKKNGDTWEFMQKIYASDGSSADNFGKSIAVDGNYIVVGADNEDFGSGSAYVFYFDGTNWTQIAKLQGDDNLNDYFGHSVDISGDYIAVGAWQANVSGSNEGAVFVFKNNSGTWEFLQKLSADNAEDDDVLGYSVAIDGDYIVTGAHGDDFATGSAYVFYNNGETWEQQAKLTQNNGSYEDYFGKNVSISGDFILVAAQKYDTAKGDEGAVYLFVREGTSWARTSMFSASDASDTGLYGYCTAIDGNYAFASSVQNNGTVYALGPDNVSVNNTEKNDISVFPNPVYSYFKIKNINEEIKSLTIFDLSGKILFKQNNVGKMINISNLPPGNYFLKINTKNQDIYKMIIKN